MTNEQLKSLEHIHTWHNIQMSLDDFIATAQPQVGFNDGSLMVHAGSIWIGIETDGSRHS